MTPAEYPPDALAKGIRGTVTVDITINPAGDVTTASVVSGPQELRGAAFTIAMGLKYEAGPSTTTGRVGVQFQIDRTSWGVRVVELRAGGPTATPAVAAPGGSQDDWKDAVRVGGNIGPPRKVKDVPPEYPKAAQDARVQGVVILEARVDESGNVSDVRLLRSIPLLDQAALAAVKQWKYEPALLNGVPTPVVMTMTVNFTLRDEFEIRVFLPDGGQGPLTMFGGGMMHVVLPQGGFRLRAMRDRTSKSGAVISVFQEDGKTLLGEVYAEVGGPMVAIPTVPGVGLQLVAIR
jgi:TonB family protein